MSILYFLVQQTMLFSIPLLIAALGGMFSERSGVWNIALEGIMVMGGFGGVLFISVMQDTMSGQPLLILAILVSAASGMIFSLTHAFASIHLKADQTISGTALNLFAPSFAIFTARMIKGVKQVQFSNTFRIEEVPVLGKIPVLGPMLFQNVYITTYAGILILIASAILLYKTRYGLRLRSCGEHPEAADSVGINVYGIRYSGVLISGALAGLGGLVFIVPTSTGFSATVSGYGFLAIAVLIFGQWTPKRILLASLFFGFMKTLSSAYGAVPFLNNLQMPTYLYKITPYIITLAVLAFTSKTSVGPKASGTAFDKG